MSVTLITLMVIQVYWIKNAVMVREAIFNRDVNKAVEKVIFQLDRIDRINMIRFRKNDIRIRQKTMLNYDSTMRLQIGELDKYKSNLIGGPNPRGTFASSPVIDKMFDAIPKDRSLIENRISKSLIDSLLTIEFRNAGLNTKFDFGVYNPIKNRLTHQKNGQFPTELMKSPFRYLLFPGEIFSTQNYLMIYFPYERQYLISRIWLLLVLSIFLIATIIFSFTYVITTVFRQKKLSEIKNDFINNMTHEFKTPISTISLACQALTDKDVIKNPSVYDTYLNIISEENNRLSGMAERILQSARLQKGEVVIKPEEIHLHDVITDAIQKVSLQVEKKGGKIELVAEADQAIIIADRVHITNIIFNLLDNANKYTPWAPLITIKTKNIAEGLLISVKDNGVGISKSNQKKVFDRLYRVPTGNVHNVKGFGLGLSYVKSVVEKHNGKITIDSELKKGSTFSIYLPLK